jgi:hypothetical protein
MTRASKHRWFSYLLRMLVACLALSGTACALLFLWRLLPTWGFVLYGLGLLGFAVFVGRRAIRRQLAVRPGSGC